MPKSDSIRLNCYFKEYLKDLLILSIPLFIGSLGHTLIGITDVMVVSRYSIKSLAAISIANSIIFTIFIFGIGICTAISIILSNFRGSNERIKKYLPSVLAFSGILSIIFSAICFCSKYLIPYFGFEASLIPYIQNYISVVAFSMFGIFFFEGIKQFLQAYEIVKLPNVIILISVLFNLLFDIIFVFGYGIIPAMGANGAAIATLLVRTLTGLIMIIYISKYINFKNSIDFGFMKYVFKIGFPIGVGFTLEFLAFNVITILIAQEATILAAIHSILISLSSVTYMVPMAVSTAISIKVAYYYGANLPVEIKRYSYTALLFTLVFMSICSVILYLFPSQIIGLFTNDADVIKISIPLICVVAAYQIFDGMQGITSGILKGFKMTKTVTACVIAGYWFIGAPIAYITVYKYNMSLKGFWIALAISLCFMGTIQLLIAKYRYKSLLKNN